LEEKAAELALTSKYKSEFLANMSHELRTPLNSILILAQQLAENAEGNLNAKQVEFSRNVYAAGADLLNLISDILDLSKIESGTVTVEPEEISFKSLRDAVERSFRHVAESKQLAFDIELDPQLPPRMYTDVKRLQQVLRNLLSNAFKFTSHGSVVFRMNVATSGWSADHAALSGAARVIAFEVEDTGIGIPPDKQRIIFEAFHQADAGTSRRYGGTGLGLAISRELATLLGGEIRLNSAPGRGSIFTFYLPENYCGPHLSAIPEIGGALRPAPLIVQQVAKPAAIPDDRESIAPGDPVVLIVEDDAHFAQVLLDLARERGLKGVVTTHGAHARELARQFSPRAIMLDIFLPDMLGWTVLNHLKQDPMTRHVPVQIISVEEERLQGLGHGAFSYLIKPATTDELKKSFDRVMRYAESRRRRLLVVEDDDIERQSIVELLSHENVEITSAGTGSEAMEVLRNAQCDCLILDLRLPDISGFELMEKIRENPDLRELPIVVCTGKELTEHDSMRLARMAESVVLKDVRSPERLLDEVSLFLHLVTADLPAHKQQMLERLRQSDQALIGKKILVVDDDVRNIFALTSLLEQHGLQVVNAENGMEAIALLDQDREIDAVLMDIMMPEMDGYETMRRIRLSGRHRMLPILALTAKAMKGDREKCLEAGASDYIAKPVNAEELLALLRIWLFGKPKTPRINYEYRSDR
jgi:CheY-like chemotaxis protein/nitrogen-specific signal transduction histidine kinase